MSTSASTRSKAAAGPWFSLPVRVYYEDTDAQGVVYFASYLRFMERGRAEWLRGYGLEQSVLSRDYNLCFSLVSTSVRFLQPARIDDSLLVQTRLAAMSGARIRFEQQVRHSQGEVLFCNADCDVACLAADTFKPRRLPPELRTSLAG